MLALALLLLIPLAWGLVAGHLGRWSITAPIAMVAAGVALTAGSDPIILIDLETSSVEHFVEVVLAVVLFVDATEVEGGFFGREPRVTARLLLIALPLSLVLAVAFGALTFPHANFWIVACIATVVMPTDLTPVVALVRDRRVPARLRDIINVESGFNDGFIAPLFLFALAAAHASINDSTPDLDALIEAAPAFLVAIASGAVIGFGGGWLISRTYTAGWTEPPALRIAVLTLPLLSYLVAVGLKGNGFVAAFVAGLLFRPAFRLLPKDAMHLVEDTSVVLGLLVWFLFGQFINNTLRDGTDWAIVLFAALAVLVARLLPVVLSLSRTSIERQDRWFLGWVSPRGLASIVFGLLAFIDLDAPENEFVGEVMVVTVLVSVIVHGASVVPLASWYGRRGAREKEASASETAKEAESP